MTKLRTLLMSAKLRRETLLCLWLQNTIGWSSIVLMLQHHAQLREHVKNLYAVKINALLFKVGAKRKVATPSGTLAKLDKITEKALLFWRYCQNCPSFFWRRREGQYRYFKTFWPKWANCLISILWVWTIKETRRAWKSAKNSLRVRIGEITAGQGRRTQLNHQSGLYFGPRDEETVCKW